MSSLIETVNNIKAPTTKAMYGSGYGMMDYLWRGLSGTSNNNIRNDKFGYALAYLFVPDVRRCIDTYALFIGRMLSKIIENNTPLRDNDKVIAQSDDVRPRHVYYAATARHRRRHKIPFEMRLAYMYMLYDEMYVLPIRNMHTYYSDIQVLNTLGLEPQIIGGEVQGYWYNGADESKLYKVDQVAYDHGFHPGEDMRGSSLIQTAIDDIDVLRNLVAYLKAWFANGAQLGVIGSLKDPRQASDRNLELLQSQINAYVANTHKFKPFIANLPVDFETLESPDISHQIALDEPTTRRIYRAFGLPMVLAGDTSSTKYDESDTVVNTWVKYQLEPHLENIAEFISDQLLPFLAPNDYQRFEFDTSEYSTITANDKASAELTQSDVNAGLLSMADAMRARGHDVKDKVFEELYIFDGIPVSKSELPNLWKYKLLVAPGTYNAQEVTAEPQSVNPTQVVPTGNDEQAPAPVGESAPVPKEAPASADKPLEIKHVDACDCAECKEYKLFAGDGLYPDEETIRERITNELETWKRFELKRFGKANPRPFETDILPHYVRFAVIDCLAAVSSHEDISKAFAQVLELPRVKSSSQYRQNVRAATRALWAGTSNKGQFFEAMYSAVGRAYRQAFKRGVERAGLNLDDLTSTERETIDTLIDSEMIHAGDLADYIIEHNKASGGQLAAIHSRVEKWVSRYERVEDKGYVIASRDKRLKWKRNPAKDSCTDCIRLDGRVYRASTWNKQDIEPRSPRLNCFGIHCGCTLEPTDDPVTKGRFPVIRGPK